MVNNTGQPVSLAERNMLKMMFYLNSYGNTDGSGIMYKDLKGNISGHKRALPSPDFIEGKWGSNFFNKQASSCQFIGCHTRYSTVGGNSDQNSHPFNHGKFLLMQNGTAGGYAYNNLVPNDRTNHEVDTECVAYAFSKIGVEATLDKYEGAGVFAWIDMKEKSFNIVKNSERELWVGKVRGKDLYFLATEQQNLDFAAYRCKVDLEYVDYLADDTWHIWDDKGDYDCKDLVVKKYVYVAPSYNKYGYGYGSSANTTGGNTSQSKKFPTTSTQNKVIPLIADKTEPTVHAWEELDDDEFGMYEFVANTQDTVECACCFQPIEIGDNYNISKSSPEYIVCDDCVDVMMSTFQVEFEPAEVRIQ